MSKPPRKKPAAPRATVPQTAHRDVAEGRAPSLELQSAVAIEAANRAVGFDPPPAAQAVIDAADPAELEAARQAVADAEALAPINDQAEDGEPPAGQQTPQE